MSHKISQEVYFGEKHPFSQGMLIAVRDLRNAVVSSIGAEWSETDKRSNIKTANDMCNNIDGFAKVKECLLAMELLIAKHCNVERVYVGLSSDFNAYTYPPLYYDDAILDEAFPRSKMVTKSPEELDKFYNDIDSIILDRANGYRFKSSKNKVMIINIGLNLLLPTQYSKFNFRQVNMTDEDVCSIIFHEIGHNFQHILGGCKRMIANYDMRMAIALSDVLGMLFFPGWSFLTYAIINIFLSDTIGVIKGGDKGAARDHITKILKAHLNTTVNGEKVNRDVLGKAITKDILGVIQRYNSEQKPIPQFIGAVVGLLIRGLIMWWTTTMIMGKKLLIPFIVTDTLVNGVIADLIGTSKYVDKYKQYEQFADAFALAYGFPFPKNFTKAILNLRAGGDVTSDYLPIFKWVPILGDLSMVTSDAYNERMINIGGYDTDIDRFQNSHRLLLKELEKNNIPKELRDEILVKIEKLEKENDQLMKDNENSKGLIFTNFIYKLISRNHTNNIDKVGERTDIDRLFDQVEGYANTNDINSAINTNDGIKQYTTISKLIAGSFNKLGDFMKKLPKFKDLEFVNKFDLQPVGGTSFENELTSMMGIESDNASFGERIVKSLESGDSNPSYSEEAYFGSTHPFSQQMINHVKNLREELRKLLGASWKDVNKRNLIIRKTLEPKDNITDLQKILENMGKCIAFHCNIENAHIGLFPELNAYTIPLSWDSSILFKDMSKGVYKKAGMYYINERELRTNSDIESQLIKLDDIVLNKDGWKFRNKDGKVFIISLGIPLLLDDNFETSDEDVCSVIFHEIGHNFQQILHGTNQMFIDYYIRSCIQFLYSGPFISILMYFDNLIVGEILKSVVDGSGKSSNIRYDIIREMLMGNITVNRDGTITTRDDIGNEMKDYLYKVIKYAREHGAFEKLHAIFKVGRFIFTNISRVIEIGMAPLTGIANTLYRNGFNSKYETLIKDNKKYEQFADMFAVSYGFGSSSAKLYLNTSKFIGEEYPSVAIEPLNHIPILSVIVAENRLRNLKMMYNVNGYDEHYVRIAQAHRALEYELKNNKGITSKQRSEIEEHMKIIKSDYDEYRKLEMENFRGKGSLSKRLMDKFRSGDITSVADESGIVDQVLEVIKNYEENGNKVVGPKIVEDFKSVNGLSKFKERMTSMLSKNISELNDKFKIKLPFSKNESDLLL